MRLLATHRLTPAQTDEVRAVLAAEELSSGRRPWDEARRMALAAADPGERWLGLDGSDRVVAVADIVDRVAEVSAGTADQARDMIVAVTDVADRLWTHGDRSSARRAADRLRLTGDRELLLLSRDISSADPVRPLPDGVTIRVFDERRDTDAWLALNRVAFADLADQGSWTRADLAARLGADWFEPADFLVAADDSDALVGFHWTKVDVPAATSDRPSGEVFVIAVAPDRKGTGLAGSLLDTGLHHLAERGLTRAHLFVDAANTRAVALYERAGFRRVDTDRQYRLTPDVAGDGTG